MSIGNFEFGVGSATQLGAVITATGVNFAVYADQAEQLYLCLFDSKDQPQSQLPMFRQAGGYWSIEVSGLSAGQAYGFRADGAFCPEQLAVFNANKLLLDPYGKSLSRTVCYHPHLSAMDNNGQFCTIDSADLIAKNIVTTSLEPIEAARNRVVPEERCLYELHVKGFTQQLPLAEHLKGKYLGLAEPVAINHLKSLGITTIQLMPCFSFMDEAHLVAKGLTNYWGYNPVSFFAPDHRYAIADPISEFRSMVTALRHAGFEIILDVVYNHTGEGELQQAMLNFRGLANTTYYRHEQGRYLNFTGCGNCIDTYQPIVSRLVCDSLRYWYNIMGVDGFRFDLGVDLGRTHHGFDPYAPLLTAIAQDPILSQATLVSEPWDIGPEGYQLGRFPVPFLECNDRYRDTVRRFWRGDEGVVADFATCLMGSRDIFHKGKRPANHSINYITYHDGYTLRDLVSYHRRHNLANGESNRDGHGENLSQNFAHEGDTDIVEINQQRLNQQLCFIATLLLSQGTPHLLGGDELNRSQRGNNNAYCQDNELTWLNWQENSEKSQLTGAIQQLLKLRRNYPMLAQVHLQDDALYQNHPHHHVNWINECGQQMTQEDWHDPERDFLSVIMGEHSATESLWLLFYRDDQPLRVRLPCGYAFGDQLYSTSEIMQQNGELHLSQRCVALFSLKVS